jgi:hypothetical protein
MEVYQLRNILPDGIRAIASNLDEGAKIAIKKSALRHGKSYPVVRFWRFFPAEWQSSGE